MNKLTQTLLLTALIGASYANAQSVQSTSSFSKQQGLDHIIAMVNETPILESELKAAVQKAKTAILNANQPLPPQKTLEEKILDGLIDRTIQVNIIKRSGKRLNDQAVNDAMLTFARKRGLTSLSDLQEQLENNRTGSYAVLREKVKDELTIKELRNETLRERVKITEQDVDYFLRSPESQEVFNSNYHTYHYRINLPENATQKNVEDALVIAKQIRTDLDANIDPQKILVRAQAQNKFSVQGGDMGSHEQKALPAYIKDSLISLNIGDTTEPVVQRDGIHIAKLVDRKEDTTRSTSQWQVRHILVAPNQVLSNEQAQQTIEELYQRLLRDEDFVTLASTYSDDPGSASLGGSLGWVTKGQMVPEFEKVMLNTPIGDYSTPFQSKFGWHILKVEKQRNKDSTQDYKKKVAREAIFKRQSKQAMEDWMQELRAESYIAILDNKYKPKL